MKNPLILRWALIIAIVIVLNLFFNFSLQLVYQEPQYQDFCKNEQVKVVPQDQKQCVAGGGAWTEDQSYNKNLRMPVPVEISTPRTTGYCDPNFTCQKKYDEARKSYDRNAFIVLIVLGAVSVGIGFALTNSAVVVSSGLSLGGLLSFIIASIRYWSILNDYWRVIILALALAFLIWLGVKKFQD
ncbi:MAG: hypothetical protein COX02_01390 [Candidatus Vogelbacteria bacterium CG22_combo_CG10-13_8_21_14_all_37_9]|uniref:Transmembrane protein n=1 Tax=Candidatus Vogelbacteria bacterium CG22_combo_CG10-13_8_21_14_all_37_9 TaxID=1975046 RepID=A0A2H0BMM9_9BACT|nr:MAG: hypothetical protein BK005_01560 [bacterium CG10_37_50]PIP58248.1 MAG: hypothetical protein COX02_01390 [Candidatus Vogelbacteria bacterium CG22_combo_CG10-13_8_21_14_all_37_9]